MVRIGLMGCGSVADFGHIPAIQQTSGVELAAIYDPNPSRLAAMAQKHRVSGAFTDERQFFEQKLDAVVIASPAAVHLENVRSAADRGLSILCEKPLGDTESQSLEVLDAAERGGASLFTGFVYRFSPVARTIREWIREGIVGEVRSLRLIYLWDLHGQYEQDAGGRWAESARWRGRMLEGGPMVDCGVHQIDLARWWLGQEMTVESAAGAWVSNYAAPDHAYLHLRHSGGALTTVEMSFSYGHTAKKPLQFFSYELIGDGGVIRYDRNGYLLEARNGQGVLTSAGASEKNFHGMYSDFATWLETGVLGDLASGHDGYAATRLAEDATERAIKSRVRQPQPDR